MEESGPTLYGAGKAKMQQQEERSDEDEDEEERLHQERKSHPTTYVSNVCQLFQITMEKGIDNIRKKVLHLQ